MHESKKVEEHLYTVKPSPTTASALISASNPQSNRILHPLGGSLKVSEYKYISCGYHLPDTSSRYLSGVSQKNHDHNQGNVLRLGPQPPDPSPKLRRYARLPSMRSLKQGLQDPVGLN
jgi:hypothetical protein